MPYTIIQRESDSPHEWVVATANCNPDDDNDALVRSTIDLLRRSYGESEIIADAVEIMASEIADGEFQVEHLLAAIREGLPEPGREASKPIGFRTYRSQSAELVAKAALAVAYQFEYPAAPQEGTVNPNQPVLGFDGWGLLPGNDGEHVLVLIQVKATDDSGSPPGEAEKLAADCLRPRDRSAVCRALSVLARLLRNNPMQGAVMRMLEKMGRRGFPDIHIAPAIIRGRIAGRLDDLQPVRAAAAKFSPATGRGIVVTIGADLTQFGELVMRKARQAA